MAINQELTERAARHAVYVQRYAGGLDSKFLPFLERLKDEVAAIIVRSDFQRLRQDQLIAELTSIQQTIYAEYGVQLEFDLSEFGISEAEWQQRNISSVVIDADVGLPTSNQIIAAMEATPLVFPDANVAKSMQSFIADWSESEINRVNNAVRTGFVMGLPPREIVKSVDGIVDKTTRANNRAVVRTSLNHMSSVARTETMKQNSDLIAGYQWMSTLDMRTSTQCRSLDQEVFLFDDEGFKPLPPIHPNCRSGTAPVLHSEVEALSSRGERPSRGDEGSEDVGATSTYYGWLKRQSAAFQDATIGKTRGRLLRNGGLTSDEFAKLSVDQRFRPLTLDEMKARNPDVFEAAGLD